MPRMVEMLEGIQAGVAAVARRVIESPPTRLAHALLNYTHSSHELVPVASFHPATLPAGATAGAPQTSVVQEIQNFAYSWSPVVMILFFSALTYLMWRTLKA